MSEYIFRLANATDKNDLIAFMDANWGEKHPLLHVKEFFEFYYEARHGLQFALCYENDTLLAAVGYTFANNATPADVWISILCAQKGKNGAGLELVAALPSLVNARVISCNNIRKKIMAFYAFLGFTVARLPHYYRLNSRLSYKIAKVDTINILPVEKGDTLQKITSERELNECYIEDPTLKPFKDKWYILRRYFNYPFLKYDVWKLKGEKSATELLITRTVDVDGINVVRVVDFIGKAQSFIKFGHAIDTLIKQENAEYADFYCYGIDADIINKAGFTQRTEDDDVIIPNYLSPLLRQNTEYYFCTADNDNFTMFKADGDQDRPNIEI